VRVGSVRAGSVRVGAILRARRPRTIVVDSARTTTTARTIHSAITEPAA
jgi:2-C-methyl-D-erythritol 4-phosphate cytidylyltransferase